MPLHLASCPSFAKAWDSSENVMDGERQLYLDAADYVRHVLGLVHQEASSELEPIFDAIERLHLEGDDSSVSWRQWESSKDFNRPPLIQRG